MGRAVVYGAGAIGGVLGASLFEHGEEVVLVARGEHGRVIKEQGLTLLSPGRSVTLSVPVVEHPDQLEPKEGDLYLLAMKSQDTEVALRALHSRLRDDAPIVCVQNGVDNERRALRYFANVYGVVIMCPASHLAPGVVVARSHEPYGVFDVGRFPKGIDEIAERFAEQLRAGGFGSVARSDIMSWKYGKLVNNVANAVEVVCGLSAGAGEVTAMARSEAEACLRHAGIDFMPNTVIDERRRSVVRRGEVAGYENSGSSTWQSVIRGAPGVESDYLNGEIALIGRMCGFPTPANALLQELAREVASGQRSLGGLDGAGFRSLLAVREQPD